MVIKAIPVEIPEGKEAKWVDGVLTLVDEHPQDITERIKTFGDAVDWCRENGKGKLIDEYAYFLRAFNEYGLTSVDLLAYTKLRIITTALNEGWEPTFKEDEYRYTPQFDKDGEIGYTTSMKLYGDLSSKLCLKNEDLALYAATQFKDIYMDFCKGKE